MRFTPDDVAASPVIGTLLLVAITVAVGTTLIFSLGAVSGPAEERPALMEVRLSPGQGGYGTGDETLTAVHRGGKPLPQEYLVMLLENGGPQERILASGAGFGDTMTIGESWTVTRTINVGVVVRVNVVFEHHVSAVLAGTSFDLRNIQDCSSDIFAPTASLWTQSPADVQTGTSGDVTVEITLSDDCAGVDLVNRPTLQWRLNDGSNPPWTDEGMMGIASGSTLRGTIPEPVGGWITATTKTLEYQAASMADQIGNTADSPLGSDVVETPSSRTEATCPMTVTLGSASNCIGWQDDADGDAEARIDEQAVFGLTQYIQQATTVVDDPLTVNDVAAIGPPDDAYAVLLGDSSQAHVKDFPAGTGAILYVNLHMEAQYDGSLGNDKIRLRYYIGGALVGTHLDADPTDADTAYMLNVTTDRPWAWSDILNLAVEADFKRQGAEDAVDFWIDALWVEVITDSTTYRLDAQTNFTGVPAAPNYQLEMRYRTFVDSYDVQVWDGATSSWNTRGIPLTQTTLSVWPSYTLTAGEYNGGEPRVRFVDRETTSGSPGILLIEYLQVRAS